MLAVSLAMMVLIIGEVPVQDVLITRYTVDAWRSRVFGIKFLLALAPASLAPILVALLHGSDGSFVWLYIVLGFSALAIAIFVVLLPDPKTLSNPSHVIRNV